MTKRIVLLLSCVFCFQLVLAQTMSDEQIKNFILTEQEKGTDQRTIATKLLQKGVTPDRLREIKSRYENEKTLLGVSSLNDKKSVDSRLREKNKESHEAEKMEVVESALTEMQDDKPLVFGRNIFNNKLLTFESSKNIPTPSDYVLGAGDVVVIDIWGASQNMIEAEISPDGKIIVSGIGPLYLAGKNVVEANKYVNDVLSHRYAESSINLSLASTRSIVVQVLGEVVAPGSYTMSSLSTAFNALYAAGGIGDLGTLRSINVFRGGKKIAVIDVYDYIFNGNSEGNVALQDNDVISVGAYNAIVNIEGKIKRPMMYEMKENETLSSLIGFSGGFVGDAYSEKLRVVRKSGREYSLFTVDREDMGSFAMCDGDAVYVDSVIQRYSNMVEISGAVFFPGQYQLCDDINSVAELIEVAGGLREDAFLNRAVLHHRNADNTIEAMSVDVKGIVEGSVADIALRNNDILFIPSVSEMKGEQLVTVNGEVNFPGVYKFAKNTTIEDLILQAGGLTRAASMAKIDVYRQLYNPKATTENNFYVQSFTFEIKDGFVVDGNAAFVLEPFDEINVRRSPAYENIKNVEVTGAVLYQGAYVLENREYRLSDLVKQAGGLSEKAYAKGAILVRKSTDRELVNYKELQNKLNIAYYEDLLEENNSNLEAMDSLMKVKSAEDIHYEIAIDLEKALEKPGSRDDIILCEGDLLTIPEYSSTVKVRGEVMFPTALNWRKGKTVNYYVKHAGGFGNKAKKNAIFIVKINGDIEEVSRYSRKKVQPGCEIVVPRKKIHRSMTTGEIVTISTSTASLATMIVTMISLLKK